MEAWQEGPTPPVCTQLPVYRRCRDPVSPIFTPGLYKKVMAGRAQR